MPKAYPNCFMYDIIKHIFHHEKSMQQKGEPMKRQITIRQIVTFMLVLSMILQPVSTSSLIVYARDENEAWEGLIDTGSDSVSEQSLFLQKGESFFNTYIKDKYHSVGDGSPSIREVFTLESVYAFEYAINKDFLSDEAVSALTGPNGVVNLDTYTDIINAFCAELLEKIVTVGVTPDFSDLCLMGFDPAGCTSVFEYIFFYANIDKHAARKGSKSDKLRDKNGNLILGWVLKPDGKTEIQNLYDFDLSNLCGLYNGAGEGTYGIVSTDDRYFIVDDQDNLVKEQTVINFSKNMPLYNVNWYDLGQSTEDRDITWNPDDSFGVHEDDLESMIGTTNFTAITGNESFTHQRLFYMVDTGLPILRDSSETRDKTILKINGSENISLSPLSTFDLNVYADNDEDRWIKDHLLFMSSDERIASVDGTGRVYGISEGTAKIYVTAKSSGRTKPLVINVTVSGSLNTSPKVSIGYMTEDAVFDGSGPSLDLLASNVIRDGGDAVILIEQPGVMKNGTAMFDVTETITNSDSITIERRDKTNSTSCFSISLQYYKKVAAELHAHNKKLFLQFQVMYGDDFATGISNECYWTKMRDALSDDDPSNDAEAYNMAHRIFDAMGAFFVKYGPMYDEIGIDGIVLDGAMGSYDNKLMLLTGNEWWPALTATIRSNFHGEIRGYYNLNNATNTAFLNNADFLENIDALIITCDGDMEVCFSEDNPDIDTCKKAFQKYYGSFTDKIYERYSLPIETSWYIPATKFPCNGYSSTEVGKGKMRYLLRSQYYETTVDYLQQMIVWQAILELFSSKPYTNAIYSRYCFTLNKSMGHNYTTRSGFDVGATIYHKPACGLLKTWSKGRFDSVSNTAEKCASPLTDGVINPCNFIMCKKSGSLSLSMADTENTYSFTSSDSSIFSVDSNGILTGTGVGSALLFVESPSSGKQRNVIPVSILPSDDTLYNLECIGLSTLNNAGVSLIYTDCFLLYELIVRINEENLGSDFINSLFTDGFFDINSGKNYSAFVDKVSKTAGFAMSSLNMDPAAPSYGNDYYRYMFLIKDPYDANLYNEGSLTYETPDDGRHDITHPDGSYLYGFLYDPYDQYIGTAAQYTGLSDKTGNSLYFSNAIITGGRVYFICSWDKCTKVEVYHFGTEDRYELPLDEDGGTSLSAFSTFMSEKAGIDNIAEIAENNTFNNGNHRFKAYTYDAKNGYGEKWFMPVILPLGYPVETIFDFECADVTDDAVFVPRVTVNYSGGEVTYQYRKKGTTAWSSTAPTEKGTYEIKATVAATGNFRPHSVIKTVVRSETVSTPATPVVDSISIYGATKVEKGKTITLSASVHPAGAIANVIWSSSDIGIATVNENGVVTGIKNGDVVITAAAKDTTVKRTYKITVFGEEENTDNGSGQSSGGGSTGGGGSSGGGGGSGDAAPGKTVSDNKTIVSANTVSSDNADNKDTKDTDGINALIGKTVESGGLTYKIKDDGTACVMSYKPAKSKGKIKIPNTIKADGITVKVTSVTNNAFKGISSVTQITVGKNVTTIGKGSFSECENLKILVIKTGKLTAPGVKKSLKGSSVTTIKLKGKTARKNYKKYLKIFTKKNAGRKVEIKK